jgi:hypothetical protein
MTAAAPGSLVGRGTDVIALADAWEARLRQRAASASGADAAAFTAQARQVRRHRDRAASALGRNARNTEATIGTELDAIARQAIGCGEGPG